MIKRNDLTFEIQKTSVRLYYNKQCIVFNQYNTPSYHNFDKFKKKIQNSRGESYGNLNDVFELARVCNVRACGSDITITKNIAF